MNHSQPVSFKPAIFMILYLLLVTTIIYISLSNWAYDDPFITYRYARNLSEGQGFVYNPGFRVQSTTTPLFTMILATLGRAWPDLPRLANAIGALSLALGAFALWDLARTWKTAIAGWVALALYPTFGLLLITLGSETPLYLALCLGAFASHARQRYGLTATLAALAALTRPDGILVAAILAAEFLLARRRPIPWGAVGLYLGLLLPWYLFAWAYFGSPIPATLATKQHQAGLAVSQGFAQGFLSTLIEYSARWQYWISAPLALAGLVEWARQPRRWLTLFAWTGVYFAAYSLLSVSRYFWYYAPLVPAFVVAAGLGLEWLYGLTERHNHRLARLAAILLITIPGLAQVYELANLQAYAERRAVIYQAIGEWLQAHTPENATVGALEVGIIGYYAQRPMVDFAGLIQPDVARNLAAGATYETGAIYALMRYHPDYVVLRKGDFRTLRQGFIDNRCQAVRHFPGEAYGFDGSFNIYACPK